MVSFGKKREVREKENLEQLRVTLDRQFFEAGKKVGDDWNESDDLSKDNLIIKPNGSVEEFRQLFEGIAGQIVGSLQEKYEDFRPEINSRNIGTHAQTEFLKKHAGDFQQRFIQGAATAIADEFRELVQIRFAEDGISQDMEANYLVNNLENVINQAIVRQWQSQREQPAGRLT